MLLNRLQIKGFRGFEDLKVEDLRQVNLVIGRNNAGKTSLLEAIYLLCAKVGSPFAVLSRGETAPSSILNLFHGRPTIESNAALTIGSDQRQIELSLHRGEVKWRTNDGVDDSFGLYDPNRYGLAALPVFLEARSDPRFSVPAIWKDIALTPKEDDIVNCLQLVLPTLERIAVVEGSLIVRLKDVPTPISMATLGGGVVRLFYLACALILAANNICLIEEIEDGVHHTIHEGMWKFIYDVAKRHNIQVFATTHGLDCLRGFALASYEVPEVSAQVIRIEERKGQVSPVLFDERQFQIAAESEIEIR